MFRLADNIRTSSRLRRRNIRLPSRNGITKQRCTRNVDVLAKTFLWVLANYHLLFPNHQYDRRVKKKKHIKGYGKRRHTKVPCKKKRTMTCLLVSLVLRLPNWYLQVLPGAGAMKFFGWRGTFSIGSRARNEVHSRAVWRSCEEEGWSRWCPKALTDPVECHQETNRRLWR